MSETLRHVQALVQAKKVRASQHGYTELRKAHCFMTSSLPEYLEPKLWRIILITRKVLACLFYN